MAQTAGEAHINVRKVAGRLLMIRGTVDPLFQRIARLATPRVILDFSGVEFMSRSFADEYRIAKAKCPKQIEERNTPPIVVQMMSLVSQQASLAGKKSPSPEPANRPSHVIPL